MEHIEKTGVHSGDSLVYFTSTKLTEERKEDETICEKIVQEVRL